MCDRRIFSDYVSAVKMSDSEENTFPLSKRQRLSGPYYNDRSEDEMDDLSSTTSTLEESSRSDTPTLQGRRGCRWIKQPKKCKLNFKCTNYLKENHGQPLFGVQINLNCADSDPVIFATVGHNRVTIYECQDGGKIKLLQAYCDPSTEENFYCCAWSFDPITNQPILAAAGLRGVIRILSLSQMQCIKDFNLSGSKIVSCGMDHSLKMWRLDTSEIKDVMQQSHDYNSAKASQPFPTLVNHFPDFSTRDIHRNYVDCTRWLGNMVLSKSCENCIVCWKPGPLDSDSKCQATNVKSDDSVSILHRFDYRECEIWYMRFCLDYQQKILALGNQVGRIFIWDLDVEDPSQTK
nr:hypothetical protein BaRGS_009278 [Batillaria attramentaria]